MRVKFGFDTGNSNFFFRVNYRDDVSNLKSYYIRWDTVSKQYVLFSGASSLPTGILTPTTAYGPISNNPFNAQGWANYTNYMETNDWQVLVIDLAAGLPPTATINGFSFTFPTQAAGPGPLIIRSIDFGMFDNAVGGASIVTYVDMTRYSYM